MAAGVRPMCRSTGSRSCAPACTSVVTSSSAISSQIGVEVRDLERIHQPEHRSGRELDQAQLGDVGRFPDELGVVGEGGPRESRRLPPAVARSSSPCMVHPTARPDVPVWRSVRRLRRVMTRGVGIFDFVVVRPRGVQGTAPCMNDSGPPLTRRPAVDVLFDWIRSPCQACPHRHRLVRPWRP